MEWCVQIGNSSLSDFDVFINVWERNGSGPVSEPLVHRISGRESWINDPSEKGRLVKRHSKPEGLI